ncbi:hypothetical protein F01_420591 [Burkholderia cenocepacia]|nr:hypothetical protein F01_420591 [Burkholderia cenocepacia]
MTFGTAGLLLRAGFCRFISVFPNVTMSINNPLVLNKLSVYAT